MSPCAFVVLLLSVSVCVTVWLRPCDDCGDSWQIRLDFSSIFLVGSKKKGEKSWTSNRTNDCKQRDTQTQLTSFFLRLAKQKKKKKKENSWSIDRNSMSSIVIAWVKRLNERACVRFIILFHFYFFVFQRPFVVALRFVFVCFSLFPSALLVRWLTKTSDQNKLTFSFVQFRISPSYSLVHSQTFW